MTSEKSFENVSYWLESIQTHAPEDITAALVAAKCDCEDRRAVSKLRAQRFADQNRIKYFETSAQEGINVQSTFLEVKKQNFSLDSQNFFLACERYSEKGNAGIGKVRRRKRSPGPSTASFPAEDTKMLLDSSC